MQTFYTDSLRRSWLVRATAADLAAQGLNIPEEILVRRVAGPLSDSEAGQWR